CHRDDHAADLIEGAEAVAAAVELAGVADEHVRDPGSGAPEEGRAPAAGRGGEVEAKPECDRNREQPDCEVAESLKCSTSAAAHGIPVSPRPPWLLAGLGATVLQG